MSIFLLVIIFWQQQRSIFLKFSSERIVYMKVTEGEYKVLLWVDFFTKYYERAKYKRDISKTQAYKF